MEEVLVLLEAEGPWEVSEELSGWVEARGLWAQGGANVKNFTVDPPGPCEWTFWSKDDTLYGNVIGEESSVGEGEGCASAVGVGCRVEGEKGAKLN
jgi:hypothetical protein